MLYTSSFASLNMTFLVYTNGTIFSLCIMNAMAWLKIESKIFLCCK